MLLLIVVVQCHTDRILRLSYCIKIIQETFQPDLLFIYLDLSEKGLGESFFRQSIVLKQPVPGFQTGR